MDRRADLLGREREVHVEQLCGVLEPLEVLPQPEDCGSVGSLVAPDALEDAGPVVQPVYADVHFRVGPIHELAVHPDRVRLTHLRASY
jgi:hypothetical protein